MANHISILVALVSTFHILSIHFRLANCGTYTSICTQTPYPDLCNSLITTTQTTLEQNQFNLLEISLRETLVQAQNAHNLISDMDLTSFDELGKSAWADCLELYEDTIYQLNRSSGPKTDAVDAQTWLSAAIANEQTCKNGFLDLKLSSQLKSFNSMLSDDDFPKFLRNSLAINKAVSVRNRRLLSDERYFPEWVSAGDRKILVETSGGSIKADIVVAGDGSGDYRTITEALAAAAKRRNGTKRFVIYVKRGVYKENIEVKKSMKNLMFVGDGIDGTIVTGSKNVQDGSTTFRSATFAVSGDGFIARDMTFENTAGAHKHQAVALRSDSDFLIFYKCSFRGYQDTLYVHSQRQFYRECDIYGTIDFIFGDAVAVFQNCNIYVRKPMPNQKNTVTAQGRSDPNENTGIIIHNSHVRAFSDLRPVQDSYRSYLGRPWRKYSRTVFMKCTIEGLIDPAGWLPWSGTFGLSTLYYGEYMNAGSGASTNGRVNWPGFHVIRSPAEAGKFSAGKFLAGESWIMAAGVPVTAGL
ncbi:putative pectinesterase/pectinesterase inhibitor 6 [Sesamum alatum]|uniref:Pectinesterase n=1 Tax=Sesamum alatum TaxID=300844 RepID=A0AAE1Y5C5_9LAMI|nr:putative pectinesterase/pectinesterase inhibitor 6 [Sesamum alatum]